VLSTGLATYPDITIVCGQRERDPEDENAVTNPTLKVEVSRSTKNYDRGDKFEHHKRNASLQQYVLVSDRQRQIEIWTREAGDTWTASILHEGEQVSLASICAVLDPAPPAMAPLRCTRRLPNNAPREGPPLEPT